MIHAKIPPMCAFVLSIACATLVSACSERRSPAQEFRKCLDHLRCFRCALWYLHDGAAHQYKADKVRPDRDWDCSVGRDFCNVDFPNFGKPAMNRKAHNPYRQQRALLAIA